MAAKYYCDKCGKELYWYTDYDTGKNYSGNTDGYKTFDSETNHWLDLCNDCKNKKFWEGFYANQDWMTKEGQVEFVDGSVGVITKIN